MFAVFGSHKTIEMTGFFEVCVNKCRFYVKKVWENQHFFAKTRRLYHYRRLVMRRGMLSCLYHFIDLAKHIIQNGQLSSQLILRDDEGRCDDYHILMGISPEPPVSQKSEDFSHDVVRIVAERYERLALFFVFDQFYGGKEAYMSYLTDARVGAGEAV